MPTSQKPIRKPTSKDVPGDGMAKKAAKAIEQRKAMRQELLNSF